MSSTSKISNEASSASNNTGAKKDETKNETETEGKEDWRKSVTQSFRSNEIREISKVLASLEKGATSSSKMMLAMRFEDSIFQSSESLADYRKRLTKRLKKLQKSYNNATSSSSTSGSTMAKQEEQKVRKQEEDKLERQLRDKFGEALMYIVKNSNRAVEALREKHGNEKADNLKQHTNSIHQWSVEIGLIPEQDNYKKRRPREAGFLERLKSHLEQRVENIRRHIVNLTEPDRFLEETLARVEEDLSQGTSKELENAVRTYMNDKLNLPMSLYNVETLKKNLELLNKIVPPPRQNQEQDMISACLVYLSKIRVASQIMITYLILDTEEKAEFRGVLKKAQVIASEGIAFLSQHFKDNSDLFSDMDTNEITLEQAWLKPLQFIPTDEQQQQLPPTKRQKVSTVIRTKVLLTSGRKIPPNLLAAIKAKQATLVRPSQSGAGAKLVMSIGTAFEATIYFTPLLVTIRALPSPQQNTFRQEIMNGGLPTYQESCFNLSSQDNCGLFNLKKTSTSLVSCTLSKKLDYASSRATTVLRQCFAEIAEKNSYFENTSDFEIEISEATALLRFLTLFRSHHLNDMD